MSTSHFRFMKFVNPTMDNSPFSARVKALALICVCGVIIFFATVHSPFLYDDAHAIEDNPYIKRALKQDLSQTQSDDLNKLLTKLSTY